MHRSWLLSPPNPHRNTIVYFLAILNNLIMKVNLIALCTFVALASCMSLGGVEASQLSIEFHYNKVTAQSSIAAWNKERTELFGHSCSSSLDSGPFRSHAISFEVDKNGAGNVTIGSLSYLIHEDIKYSGGISCSRMHSLNESLVECAMSMPEAVQLSPVTNKAGPSECFSDTHQLGHILGSLQKGLSWVVPAAHPLAVHNTSATVEKRQGACGMWSQTTYRVGDGDPHQNPMNIQPSV